MPGLLVWAIAVVAGVLGWLLNLLPLDLGWGMHFLLGNSLAYTGLRALGAPRTVLAVVLASSQALILWDHPWAWAVWSLEAVIVSRSFRRSSPVVTMTLFWIFLGGPLVFLAYSFLLNLPQASALLIALKQAFNGILAITIAEIAYFFFINVVASRLRPSLPPISIEALVTACTAALIAVPCCAYLWFASDSSAREIDQRLAARVSYLAEREGQYLELILAYAHDHLVLWQHDADAASLEDLAHVFDRIEGPIDRQAAYSLIRPAQIPPGENNAGNGMLLLQPGNPFCTDALESPCLVMVSQDADGMVRLGRFDAEFMGGLHDNFSRSVLVVGNQAVKTARERTPPAVDIASVLERMVPQEPVLVSRQSFGVSVMEALADGEMVQLSVVPDWPMLRLVSWEPARALVDGARQQQRLLFLVACGLTLTGVLIGLTFGRTMRRKLVEIAGEAASLARLGVPHGRIERLTIAEVSGLFEGVGDLGKRLSVARRETEELQQTMSDVSQQLPMAFYRFSVNADGAVIDEHLSASARRVFGLVVDRRTWDRFWDAVHEQDREALRGAIEPRKPGNQSMEYRLKRPDGSFIWVLNVWTTREREGGGFRISGVMIDVSAWKVGQLTAIQAANLQGLSEVMRGMAHEMNQPLNVIKLAAFNLIERLDRPDFDFQSARARLERIAAQADRASDLIARMRAYDSDEQDSLAFAVPAVVQSACELTGQRMQSSGIEVLNTVQGNDLAAHGKPGQLQKVLVALLLNAREAILRGASEGAFPAGRIELAAGVHDGRIEITLRDTGGGFAAEELGRAFIPFAHAGGNTDDTKKNGLGLYVSKLLIERMGGRISIANVEHGACVTLSLTMGDMRDGDPDTAEAPAPV